MNGKIILNLAISLDGYIADEAGGFDWIVGDGKEVVKSEQKWDYVKFLEEVDCVVMGRNCYNQGFHKDFKDKQVYIATSEKLENYDNYTFISEDIVTYITKLRDRGKNIFLFGGGIVIDPFIKSDVIDEYVVGIIPTILGKGKKLFLENNPKIDLVLNYYAVGDGTIVMRYSKRNQ